MSEISNSSVSLGKATPRISEFRRVRKVMFSRWVVIGGLFVITVCVIAAAFAPWLAPYDPIKPDLSNALQPPSATHLLGTDDIGRDTLSRLIWGTRISLMVGIVAITIAGGFGMIAGLTAGYFGGWVNAVIMRVTDAFMSLPPIVLMLAISAALGGGIQSILISI